MTKPSIYTIGGTVQAGGGIYIKRKADDELLELCRAGELAFILSSRQVGKSSLMTQTAEQLGKENIRSVTVDLSSIGTKVTQDEWYLGILNVIAMDLNLKTDIFAWWTQYSGLGPAQRFFNFLRDVMLREINDLIILFFDEIDTTLSLPFADDFFASVRAACNARSITPEFRRLSFVLVGVATPSDLISDNNRTPFNIGHRVELSDFTLEEAMPLTQGLGDNAEQVLGWILEWSGGHPYLTQRLCEYLSKSSDEIDRQIVAQAAQDLFLGERGQQDNNLQFVRDMLVKRSPDSRRVMMAYKDIRSGKKVADDERSIIKAHLKISGVVKRQAGNLITRNQIYEQTFELKWIKENTPSAVPRRTMIASIMTVVFALLTFAFFTNQEWARSDAERAALMENAFRSASTYPERLDNIAGIFSLSDGQYADRGLELFNSLEHQQQLEMFTPTNIANVKEDQLVTALGVYQSLGFRNEDDIQIDELLTKIRDALANVGEERALKDELDAWLSGRRKLMDKNYARAKDELNRAILLKHDNPALYYDRARAYIGMGPDYYGYTLDDLTQMVQLAPKYTDAARTLLSSGDLRAFWETNKRNYPALADVVNLSPVVPVLGSADKVAFVANNEIWLMNMDGSELQQVTLDGAIKSDLQWLPDGQTILYVSGKTVKLYNISTDTVDTLTSFPSAVSLDAFRVSHDGKQVMIALSNEIFVVPFDPTTIKGVNSRGDLLGLNGCIIPEAGTQSALAVREAIWSANDKLVAWLYRGVDPIVTSLQSEQVGVYNIQACNPETIDLLDNFPGARFVPQSYPDNRTIPALDWDGFSRFVFNTFKRNNGWGELYVYDWKRQKANLLNPIENKCCYRDARWSPDGTYLFFAFQDLGLGPSAPTLFYFVPFREIGTGASFIPLSLPEGFFMNPKEAPQPALHPAP